MTDRNTISIDGSLFHRNFSVDRFQIPYAELGSLRFSDIPRQTHVEIMNLPRPANCCDLEFYAVNSSSDREPSFFIYGGPQVQCASEAEASRTLAKMRRVFADLWNYDGFCPFSFVTPTRPYTHISKEFGDAPDTAVKPVFDRLVAQIAELSGPTFTIFVCHASEDKPKARMLARAMRSVGADVWLDEWEIKVGDSIVEKINAALTKTTHLILLLSEASCGKPWVAKEWSAALMRQLADNSIVVLPVRLDDHPVPPILADLRYADCRASVRRGIAELKQSLLMAGPTP